MDSLLRDIRERDARDAGRAAAPLKPAADAVLLDTTDLTIDAADRPRARALPGRARRASTVARRRQASARCSESDVESPAQGAARRAL